MTAYRELIPIIGGLQPYFDSRIVSAPFVQAGENFLFNSFGVKSGWGASFIGIEPIITSQYSQHCAIADCHTGSIMLTPTGVQQWNGTMWEELLSADWILSDYDEYPWTQAFIDGVWIYCHPNLDRDLLYYDSVQDEWGVAEMADGCFNTPILAITHNSNRLIVLCEDTVSWSAIDRPFLFDAKFTKGNGFQSLNTREKGKPLAIGRLADGFIVYHELGMLLAKSDSRIITELESNSLVYTFREMQTGIAITGTQTLAVLADLSHIIYTNSGFYQYSQEQWTPWQQEMGVYLREHRKGKTNKMHYCQELQMLFCAVTDNSTLVYQMQYDKWVSWAETWVSIGSTAFSQSRAIAGTLGYLSTTGMVLQWNDGNSIDQSVTEDAEIIIKPLGSWIEIPVMRQHPENRNFNDTFQLITNVNIGTTQLPVPDLTTHQELDYSWDVSHQNQFDVYLCSSADSNTQFENEQEVLTIQKVYNKTIFYTCNIVAICPVLRIEATRPGTHYNITMLELSGNYTGMRL